MNEADRVRVVIVDDEPDIRLLLRIQFSHLDEFEVVGVAADGAEALDLIRAAPPDAVVMDLLMPGLNGFAGIELIQQEFPTMGIVAYTGVAGDFVRQEMGRRRIEVVLKSGDVRPLADALSRSVNNRPVGELLD